MANERRLIDANAFKKQWTIQSPEPYNTDAAEVLDTINEAPTVDAVEVVRCKDCRFAHKVDSKYEAYGCEKAAYTAPWFGADEFCSRGERRCEDGDG